MTSVNLTQLADELTAAGVPYTGLGTLDNTLETVHTYDGDGATVELPPQADPVLAAHVPAPNPYDYSGTIDVRAVVQTTDDSETEIYRSTAATRHQYVATFSFMGTDAASGVAFEASRRYVWKRVTAGAVLVGEAPLTDIPESASADWDVAIRVSGNTAIIEVIGERTGTVDWLLRGQIEVFAPGGLS